MGKDQPKFVAIDDLRPTQLSVGLAEVEKRRHKIEAMSDDQLDAYLVKKAVPVAIGPGGDRYIVDHHHLCRALLAAGKDKAVLGEVVGDFSLLDDKTFWPTMHEKGFCWPIDADGHQRPYSKIPRHVADLTGNVWRDLARELRDVAFTDEDTPFQEFMWGDYFRTFMSHRLVAADWDSAVALAVAVARLDEAEDLPGFVGKAAGDAKQVRKIAKDRGLDRDDD